MIDIRDAKSRESFQYLSDDLSFTSLLRRHFERDGNPGYHIIAEAAHLDPVYVYRMLKGTKTHPTPNTVIRLALAFRLSVSQTDELLMAAGYAPLVAPQSHRRGNDGSGVWG